MKSVGVLIGPISNSLEHPSSQHHQILKCAGLMGLLEWYSTNISAKFKSDRAHVHHKTRKQNTHFYHHIEYAKDQVEYAPVQCSEPVRLHSSLICCGARQSEVDPCVCSSRNWYAALPTSQSTSSPRVIVLPVGCHWGVPPCSLWVLPTAFKRGNLIHWRLRIT